MFDQRNLELVLQSHFPIVVIETHEERRALKLLKKVVAADGKSLYWWSAAEGLKIDPISSSHPPSYGGLSFTSDDEPDSADPEVALAQLKNGYRGSVIVLLDFHPYLTNPKIVRLVREIAQAGETNGNVLVFISHKLELPSEIRKLAATFEMSLPDAEQIRKLVLEEARLWRLRKGGDKMVRADRQAMELLVQNLQGLTVSDAKRLIRNAIYDDGAITHDDIAQVMQAKYELVGQGGVLSFEYDTASFGDVGGFGKLKSWLDRRRRAFLESDSATRLDVPKGILLLGIQGSGKSLAAKATAGVWNVPLLRLDFGALYNKYIGETEKNLRESLKTADVMSPCVLWIDEIEKGISISDSDTGTAHRVLGTLLTWMAEKGSRVFVVATANDIESLPPELVRKGRMDEIFFVDLPIPEARVEILQAHLRKRDIGAEGLDLERVAEASSGFSGAELEQAVVSGWYAAHAEARELTTDDLMNEIQDTRPLSVVMAEKIQYLRSWAQERTVPVD